MFVWKLQSRFRGHAHSRTGTVEDIICTLRSSSMMNTGMVNIAKREVSTFHHGQTRVLLSELGISQAVSGGMPFVKTPTSSFTGNLSSCSSLPHSLILTRYHYCSD